MNVSPVVSICLPCLNARPFLEARMECILAQTLRDWELIVSDNYSDDGTWEVLQRFREDRRVHLSQAPRRQMYANWNECLKRATGEYVYIATADDTCEPTLLEKMVKALEAAAECRSVGVSEYGSVEHGTKDQGGVVGGESEELQSNDLQNPVSSIPHPGSSAPVSGFRSHPSSFSSFSRPIDIAVCDYRVIDSEGATIDLDLNTHPRRFYGDWMNRSHIRDGRTEFLIHACLGIVWVTMTAVLFRRSLLDRIGFFRTDRGVAADHEWQMRACLASDIVYVPGKLATWRMHDRQATAQTRRNYYDVNILRSLEAVLDDPDSGVPEEWRSIPDWRAEILAVQRSLYQDGFGLYGNVARQRPLRFARNLWRALRNEPELLRRQVKRGFRWAPEFSVDGYGQLARLLELTGSPWPPTAL